MLLFPFPHTLRSALNAERSPLKGTLMPKNKQLFSSGIDHYSTVVWRWTFKVYVMYLMYLKRKHEKFVSGNIWLKFSNIFAKENVNI